MTKEPINGFNETGFKENAVEWMTGDDKISLTLSQKRYINRIEKMAEKFPDEVKIIARNDDGTIFARMPLSYLKLSRPKQMSNEQKQAASERFKKMWEEQNGQKS